MKIKSVYNYIISGLIVGFLLSLAGTTFEDYRHDIPILIALSSFHHFIVPIFIGSLAGFLSFVLWKQETKQIATIDEHNKTLHALLDVNSTLISTLDLDSVLQIIIDESTQLTNLDTGAIYLHEDERLYLGATTPALPPEFPEALRYDLLANHPNIQKSLSLKQSVTITDTTTAILSEAEKQVVKIRGLRSIIYIPLVIENLPVGVLILGTMNSLRSFSTHEIDMYRTFSGQAALAIENARLYKKSKQSADELMQQNEEILLLNEELIKSYLKIQKINEDLKLAKEKAEESDRLKSAFLANMNHEIRTPMNGILGFAELLKEPDLTGEQRQEYIRIIEKGGVRMLNIMNDIVDISKIESGLMKVSISETNVNDQIGYLYKFFKTEAENKGLQFFSKNNMTDTIIFTDREKLDAILTNLIKNAIKYCEKGIIEFGYESVETHDRASLRFYVKDTGIGIPNDRQEAIFERFIQADIVDKMARQGAGLGLAISKAYVEMQGGKIWVESEVGKGSTFYFTLPYYAEPEEKKDFHKVVIIEGQENPVNHEVSGLKILIAEDDESSEKYLAAVVKKISKEVLKVRTGIEAIEACRNNPDIDLVLMDIQMPEMDGYEATRQIRKFNSDLVIIAQTAFALEGDKEKAIAAGCNDYVSKPIKKDQLMLLIHNHFKKNGN